MAATLKPGWSKPSTILFASDIPANERALSFAVAQAREFGANLIMFHAYDTLVVATSESTGGLYYDYTAAASAEVNQLEPLAQRIRAEGVRCEVLVRAGLPADQILSVLKECQVDRIIMGTHSPGPIGKLLVGSVAEAVVRTSRGPVEVVGPDVVDGRYRNYATRTVLCGVSMSEASEAVTNFAAELAAQHNARLILQHVIRPQERAEVLGSRTIDELECDLLDMVPDRLRNAIRVQPIVVPGDPTEELLYQSRAQQADLIVLGAQRASAFAAIARHGIIYKVLAHSHCPVITLSPGMLAECGVRVLPEHRTEVFLAGVF